MPDAKPMAKTARRSTTSRRTEAKIGNPRIVRSRILKPTGTHGSGNWRKSSGMTLSAEKLVKRLNFKLSGWANYFHLGPVSKAYRVVDAHTSHRLRQWLCRKHRVNGKGIIRYPDQYLYETLIAGADAQPAVGEGMSACP